MTGHSLLFVRPEDGAALTTTEPAYFADLHLDLIAGSLLRGRESLGLEPYFYTTLPTADAVAYRHEVLRELGEEAPRRLMTAFCSRIQLMRNLREQAGHPAHPVQQDLLLLAAAHTYGTAVAALATDLGTAAPQSRGLRGLSAYLRRYTASPAFTSLLRDTTGLTAETSEIRYTVHIRGGRLRVARDDSGDDYGDRVEAVLARFGGGRGAPHFASSSGTGRLTRVEAAVLDAVMALYPGTLARLREFRVRHPDYADHTVTAIERETQFYLAAQELVTRLGRAGLPFCLPEISAGPPEMSVRRSADLALADKLERDGDDLVVNDFHLRDPERILVVSGPNQGGKTTFARMVGQLSHLAAIGLPVPGTAARLPLCDRIFTHFATEEDAATAHGRLEDELVRLHGILDQATPRSVLVLNEMLSSATLQDALLLAGEIMARVVRLDLLCVCVTFLDELSRLGATTVSMVSTVTDEDGVTHPFRVDRRAPDGAAYAASVAARHGLTYPQLRDRVRP